MKNLTTILMVMTLTLSVYSQDSKINKNQILSETKMNVSSKVEPGPNDAVNNWTGSLNAEWNTAGNWSLGHVPSTTEDVTISSGTPFQPSIGNGTIANCRNLQINSGAILTQVAVSYFHVYGDFNSDAGTFTQSGSSYLYFRGATNTTWDDDGLPIGRKHNCYSLFAGNVQFPNQRVQVSLLWVEVHLANQHGQIFRQQLSHH